MTVADLIVALAALPPDDMPKVIAAAVARWAAQPRHDGNGHVDDGADPLLTAKQVAEFWNVPETWVRDQARAGKLQSVQLGRYVRFKKSDLERSLCKDRIHRV
jgi:excisionase family DNA binding protein